MTALLIIVRKWKQPRCLPVDEWTMKKWYVYKMEYYSAIKNKIMKFADKWIELERSHLNEVTQTPKDKYGMFNLYVNVRH